MSIQELQQELLKIILNITVIENDREAVMKERALEIISSLRDHINDDIKYRNCRMTALDYTIFFDSRDYNSNNPIRANNPVLLELERVIKDIGGKTVQELRRNFPRRPGSNRIGWRLLDNANIEPVRAKFSQHSQNSM